MGKEVKLVFAPQAFQDLQRLYVFIEKTSARSLAKAAARLHEAFGMLARHPEAGYSIPKIVDARELVVPFGKGSYVIRYQVRNDLIEVMHMWHSREKRI